MPRVKPKVSAAEMKRVGKFGAVGALNTILDFSILNLLHFWFGLSPIQANIGSTTVAMAFSFFMNKRIVFRHHSNAWVRQAAIFFIATAFGLYVLQNGVIVLLTEIWLSPLHFAVAAVHYTGLSRFFSDSFVILNGAKAIGTIVSLAWNYIIYKKVVFR